MLLQEEPLLLQEAEPGGTGEIKPIIGAIMRVQNIISLGSTGTFVDLSWLELKL